MLKTLLIRNYALIEEQEIEFSPAYSIITGETGAGKSILLGALGLLIGNRADGSVLRDATQKCVVEGSFAIENLNLTSFFETHELEYDALTIIRREILPNGKSRAFINDVPAPISVLKTLGEFLIDIHSQHETLLLRDANFQLDLVDVMAQHSVDLQQYQLLYTQRQQLVKRIKQLQEEEAQLKASADFYQFQYQELADAKLIDGEQEQLEEELKALTHAEEIRSSVGAGLHLLQEDEHSVITALKQAQMHLSKIEGYYAEIPHVLERLNSSYIEIKDLAGTLEDILHHVQANPERLVEVEDRLNLVYHLQKKHRVSDVSGLLNALQTLENQLAISSNFDETLQALHTELEKLEKQLYQIANVLTQQREKASNELAPEIVRILGDLGMPDAQVKFDIQTLRDFQPTGLNKVTLLFTANKGAALQEMGKIASGGEVSRLMLAIKAIVCRYKQLPTIIFDEIDTGVSGKVASQMGTLMKKMSENLQVLAITHLPQIAGMADVHYKVEKHEKAGKTISTLHALPYEQRVEELAKMLSGATITPQALENARVLLHSN